MDQCGAHSGAPQGLLAPVSVFPTWPSMPKDLLCFWHPSLRGYATQGNVICAADLAKHVSNSWLMQAAQFCPSHFRYKGLRWQIRVQKGKSDFIISEIVVGVTCVTANPGMVTITFYALRKSIVQGAALVEVIQVLPRELALCYIKRTSESVSAKGDNEGVCCSPSLQSDGGSDVIWPCD